MCQLKSDQKCACGCGAFTNIIRITILEKGYVKGNPYKFLVGHTAPIATSPYVPGLRLHFSKQGQRWIGTVKDLSGKRTGKIHHSRAVYEYHHGEIPKGYRVHHVDNCHTKITDDRPENLIAISNRWNALLIPILVKHFDVSSQEATEVYLEVCKKYPDPERFGRACHILSNQKYGVPDALETIQT